MATTTQEPSTPTVEQELHELEDSNDALDQRTGNLEMRGGLAVLFAFFAIAVSLAALTVSFISSGKSSTKTVVQRAPAATAPAAPAATAPGTVAVKLGEMFVRPNATTVAVGKVTFQVQNTGKLVHEMIVSKAPVAFPSGAAKASEKTSVGEVAELQPGTSGQTKLNLTPGTYVLYCNVPGHYAAGQHIAFTVTK